LRNGAQPITDVSELADLLRGEIGPPLQVAHPWGGPETGNEHDALLSALRTNPMRPDDLVRALAIDIVTVSRRLGMLEAQGLVARYRDGRYGPC
jgi:predicted Rossmann fold nucleotide-binding protein DprA/Smf involved in DNA uptake